jgi:hypothetical protein
MKAHQILIVIDHLKGLPNMAISNELSGEIAVAILGRKRMSPRQMSDLKETVLRVHSVLQKMSDDERTYRALDTPLPTPREEVMKAGR